MNIEKLRRQAIVTCALAEITNSLSFLVKLEIFTSVTTRFYVLPVSFLEFKVVFTSVKVIFAVFNMLELGASHLLNCKA